MEAPSDRLALSCCAVLEPPLPHNRRLQSQKGFLASADSSLQSLHTRWVKSLSQGRQRGQRGRIGTANPSFIERLHSTFKAPVASLIIRPSPQRPLQDLSLFRILALNSQQTSCTRRQCAVLGCDYQRMGPGDEQVHPHGHFHFRALHSRVRLRRC